jgi:hypothetical protein
LRVLRTSGEERVDTAMQEVYYLAATYPSKTAAGTAYKPIQQLLHDERCDLSAYRFLEPVGNTWYVVVVGEQPPPRLQHQLTKLLGKRGQLTTLNDAMLLGLLARREQQITLGDWVEGHYPPPEA